MNKKELSCENVALIFDLPVSFGQFMLCIGLKFDKPSCIQTNPSIPHVTNFVKSFECCMLCMVAECC